MLYVYVHRIKADDKKVIDRMMIAVGLDEFQVIDLMTRNYDSKDPTPSVTIGTIAGRLVKNKIHAFPDFSEFTGELTSVKRSTRKMVLEALEQVAKSIESFTNQTEQVDRVEENVFEKPHTLEEFKRMWYSQNDGRITHIIINSADKRICIYNTDKPEVKADMFYSVAEFAALLDLMQVFGAKNLLIYREGKREGHEV